jgi:prepilin-type N-terminal cleavage/methylation domain-containing protein
VTRRGFTLFELIAVLALLLLLAAIIVPSISAFRADTPHRAAADVIRSELATARARAKEEGRPYRVALSEDRTRIRRAPDDVTFESTATVETASGSSPAVDYPFERVTAEIVADPTTNTPPPTPNGGWVTLATVQPDGTCLEITAVVAIKDKDNEQSALYMRLRGLTASVRVIPNPTNPSANNAPSGSTSGGQR